MSTMVWILLNFSRNTRNCRQGENRHCFSDTPAERNYRWQLMRMAILFVMLLGMTSFSAARERPNILFAIADDWGFPHAGAYGDPVVNTPAFDRLAREGVLFQHAYVSSPSCTPSRGAILTGHYHWQLEGAGNLWSIFPDRFRTYPEILQEAGYFTGMTGKGWGPGRTESKHRMLAGKRFQNFQEFVTERPQGAPFCFWLGTNDPHRPFEKGSGTRSGIDLTKIKLPACFPDVLKVRADVADYYVEVQRFDSLVQNALTILEGLGELDNTIVVMTSDHGMPFPRCKSNIYDTGVRVPFVIRWPAGGIQGGNRFEAFVSLIEVAPTLLDAAGIERPNGWPGSSFLSDLTGKDFTRKREPGSRNQVIFGKERHVVAQEAPDMGGYPCRGIRTKDFLYIRNYRPERWPNGTPHYEKATIPGAWFADTDNGPTKSHMIFQKDIDENHRKLFALSFAKRPHEELYELSKDPDQLNNLADNPAYAETQLALARQLKKKLVATGDPRASGAGDEFDHHPYLGGAPKHPQWKKN